MGGAPKAGLARARRRRPEPPDVAIRGPLAVRREPARPTRAPVIFAVLGTAALIVSALYVAREVFVPFALALLLTFVLAPIAVFLRKLRLGRVTSVVLSVLLAFMMIFGIGAVITTQLASLAENLPQYQSTLSAKIKSLRGAASGSGVVERASSMLRDLGEEIAKAPDAREEASPGGIRAAGEKPVPVEVKQPDPTPLQVVQNVLGPLLEPLATSGIVIVLVIFMLLAREDLRDRVIRLAGVQDLQRTTQALDDAAKRVSRYLLMQTVVNATYGIPVGIGLWIIGVPNAVLWGVMAMLLRFVPYVGPWIAAMFPIALCLAIDEGWSMLFWTIALFVLLEIISNNVIEPWLYGASTGLSELAVIVAAIFWTWLWGPVGLLLSTPLTSCLVVMGRHIPQLQFFDVLFGNRAVLSPEESFYQRMLAGDPAEATEQAEEMLERMSLSSYYDEVALRGLALAQQDFERGTLSEERRARVSETVEALVEDLADHDDAAPDTNDEGAEGEASAPLPSPTPEGLPEGWRDRPVLCASSRGDLDEAAAVILVQLLEKHGLSCRLEPCERLSAAELARLDVAGVRLVCVSYLDLHATTHARYLVRRLRRKLPEATIVVAFWGMTDDEAARSDPVAATGADGVVRSYTQAIRVICAAASGTMARSRPPEARTAAVLPLEPRRP